MEGNDQNQTQNDNANRVNQENNSGNNRPQNFNETTVSRELQQRRTEGSGPQIRRRENGAVRAEQTISPKTNTNIDRTGTNNPAREGSNERGVEENPIQPRPQQTVQQPGSTASFEGSNRGQPRARIHRNNLYQHNYIQHRQYHPNQDQLML